MTPEQESNARLIVKSLTTFGVTNQYLQAGILACVSKESNFIPQNENLNYTFARIKQLWTHVTDQQALAIAGHPEAMGNFMYGGKYGNSPTEGYKYRGRGFNQITFKSNYDRFGKEIGKDLINNPDLLNEPQTAADALACFFGTEIVAGFNAKTFLKFGLTVSEDVKDNKAGVEVAIQINGGRGTPFTNPILQEGYNKAMLVVDDLFKLTILT
jgi:predicted chitinase